MLQICGVPEELSVLVRYLYTDTRSAVRFASSLSEEFSIETGVKQGCVIEPDLLRRLLHRCNLGIQLGEYLLTGLDYADGIAIFAPSVCVLKEALTIGLLRKKPTMWGCKLAGRRPISCMAVTLNHTNHLPFYICNKEISCFDSFTCIGSLVTNDGFSCRDISHFQGCCCHVSPIKSTFSQTPEPFCFMALKHGPPPSPIAVV